MLRAISAVAAFCCSTAEAMVVAIRLVSSIVVAIWRIAQTASSVACCIPAIWPVISSVAFAVWLASTFTSEATTEKPLPASPARARLDRGVQCQETGLRGNRADQLDHLPHFLRKRQLRSRG